MARVLTGDKLIDSVRKRTMTPDDTSVFTDEDILDIIDEEMNVQVLETLLVLHGENLTISEDVARRDDGIYDVPYRAIGNKLRDTALVSGAGLWELTQVSIGELPDYSYGQDSNSYLDKFYVENNKIKLVQASRAYDSIRMRYHLRPNYLTKVDEAGLISTIVADVGADTFTITTSSIGKNFASTETYDIVGYKSPNKIKAFDLGTASYTETTATTATIEFTLSEIQGNYADILVGDYVTLAGQTPIPNIPTEMQPLLAQAAAIHLLEAMGDTEALQAAQMRMDKMSKATQTLVDDRVELAPKKIKSRHGALASSIGLRRNSRGRN